MTNYEEVQICRLYESKKDEITHLISRIVPKHLREDFETVAKIGFMEAIHAYDSEKDGGLNAFIKKRVMQKISKELRHERSKQSKFENKCSSLDTRKMSHKINDGIIFGYEESDFNCDYVDYDDSLNY
jgi:DNA-directed RNA polymerase specialized sigma subunit